MGLDLLAMLAALLLGPFGGYLVGQYLGTSTIGWVGATEAAIVVGAVLGAVGASLADRAIGDAVYAGAVFFLWDGATGAGFTLVGYGLERDEA